MRIVPVEKMREDPSLASFFISALYYRPGDTLIGVALTALGIPFYVWLNKGKASGVRYE